MSTTGTSRRRQRRRSRLVAAALGLAAAALLCLSLSTGDFTVPLADVVRSIVGSGAADAEFVVRTLRMPRALTAVLAGAAFGMSGALFQAVTRNPLASPDIIGVTAGASAAAVGAMLVLALGSTGVAAAAMAGAAAAAALIVVLVRRSRLSGERFVLVGIGVAALCTATTSYLLTRAQIRDAQRATVWLVGSLNGRAWAQVHVLLVVLAVLVPAAAATMRSLYALQLGDDLATAVGVRPERARLAVVAVAVAMAGVATAATGPIAFVALAAAPIARQLTRSALDLRAAALTGAVLLLAADLLARSALPSTELPVGVVTGALGAPYLLLLLARSRRVRVA